jgi:hypothetical protein
MLVRHQAGRLGGLQICRLADKQAGGPEGWQTIRLKGQEARS